MQIKFKNKFKGYTLIELAILLAIVGLMLGGLVIPHTAQYEVQKFDEAHREMNDILDAIVSYAVTNRSPGALVFYGNFHNNTFLEDYGSQAMWIPPNRPYIPCPALDTNGIEARTIIPLPFAQANNYQNEIENAIDLRDKSIGASNSNNFITNNVIYRNTENLNLAWQRNPYNVGSNVTPVGKCVVDHGYLPWRTLGLSGSTDQWGNNYTYLVSDAFSTALFGFDQTTHSYMFNQFAEANVQFKNNSGNPININQGLFLSSRSQDYAAGGTRTNFNFTPIYMCHPDLAISRSASKYPCRFDSLLDTSTSNVGLTRIDGFISYAHASMYIPTGLMSPDPIRNFNGLPFVVISAGPDKQGGQLTSPTTCDYSDFSTLRNTTIKQDAEAVNAAYHRDCRATNNIYRLGISRYLSGNSYNTIHNISQSASTQDATIGTGHPFFFRTAYGIGRPAYKPWEPKAASFGQNIDGEGFDDIVGWLTRRELIQSMKDADVLPVKDTYEGMLLGQTYYFDCNSGGVIPCP